MNFRKQQLNSEQDVVAVQQDWQVDRLQLVAPQAGEMVLPLCKC